MSLPKFDSHENIAEIYKFSPAVLHYLRLLDKAPNNLDFMDRLRMDRHRFWLDAATATLSRQFKSDIVCTEWSRSAERIMSSSWIESGCAELNLCLVALGKLGAGELNLSSDIDIIIVSKDTPGEKDFSAFKRFVKFLTNQTEYGFCLRVDNDLRPGGRFGPIISSLNQINDYYWNQGATWERVALIRARIVLGPNVLAENIKEIFSKFIYRKYLDFTLISDIRLLRNRIRETLATDPSQINLKLTRGGIRDIEFFVNSLQVIHGGRNPILRTESTQRATEQLIAIEAFPKEELNFLINFYWQLRDLENLSQSFNDQQTHFWRSKEGLQKTPSMSEITHDLNKSVSIVSSLIDTNETKDKMPATDKQPEWLKSLGFSENSATNIWKNILAKTAFSSKGESAESSRMALLYNFANSLGRQPIGKDRGMSLLLDFLTNSRAKTTFFTTLNRDPRIIEDLARLFCSAPYLGLVISSRPELIDGFVLQLNELRRDSIENLIEDLSEQKLLTEISAAKEFLQHQNMVSLVDKLSQIADEVCQELLLSIKKEFKSELEIVALGKWGSRELGLRSDLDFIFVCPNQVTEADHRVAKRLISHLTSTFKSGPLYSVDFRLRPSGSSGPLIASQSSLIDYLTNKAEAWERQSYLRARPIGNLSIDFKKICLQKRINAKELIELKVIREKLLTSLLSQTSNIDIKKSPGGLLDIELAAQTIVLQKNYKTIESSTIHLLSEVLREQPQNTKLLKELIDAYKYLRTLEQNYQLKSSYSTSDIKINSEAFELICYETKISKEEFVEKIWNVLKQSREIIKVLDPIYLPQ